MRQRNLISTILLLQLTLGFGADLWAEDAALSWRQLGQDRLNAARERFKNEKPAKNIILFIGDGMGVSTVTAARILAGQKAGGSGEEGLLSFEEFPATAMVKTYNTNQQTPDSAGTMTAMMTGVKTKAGMLSVDADSVRQDCISIQNNVLKTLLEEAEDLGMATGIVSTTRITHATPAAAYAHSPERDWESDADMPKDALAEGCLDIAQQLIDFTYGDGIEVILGGGRERFFPDTVSDPEYPDKKGRRQDGRNLVDEWVSRRKSTAYVWNMAQFEQLPSGVRRLLGLFEPSHMQFEADRASDPPGSQV